MNELRAGLDPPPPGLEVCVSGSVGRGEVVSGSDLDWFLLVDAEVNPAHRDYLNLLSRQIQDVSTLKSPGPTGTFAGLVSSHELVHRIGGPADDNLNTTRRCLLLLETVGAGPGGGLVLGRVVRNVLRQYCEVNPSLSWRESDPTLVPRFLLNDLIRFWRTMAVDYAAKARERAGVGWAIRNAKLRFSRKLLFLKGALLCLDPELHKVELLTNIDPAGMSAADRAAAIGVAVATHCVGLCPLPAAGVVAEFATAHGPAGSAEAVLRPYDRFLEIVGHDENRRRLETLSFEDAHADDLFQSVRSLSDEFASSVEALLFDGAGGLPALARRYLVF